ncbi:MAG: hypothetical protein FWG74_09600, partial [Planctomycetes bacterium]|nr:hypothetical protein [Planctomycetota bacterium]
MRHTCLHYIIAIVFTVILAISALPGQAESQCLCSQPAACGEGQILVSGAAEILVIPDRVHLAFGVS